MIGILHCLKHKKIILAFGFFLAALWLSTPAFARVPEYPSFGPISLRDQNPVYLQNLGLTPQKAEVLPFGVFELRADSAYSNLYEYEYNSQNTLDLDMELWRTSFNLAAGVRDDLEVGVEVPIVHMGGGFLDSFISKFHSFFGFPNGGREYVPNNRFMYSFKNSGTELFGFPPVTAALGDISMRVKHQLAGEDDDWPDLSWFAEVKFPTGSSSRGVGSGSMDFGLGTVLSASYKRIHGHFNAGYYVLGGNDRIENFMQNTMFAYSTAGELTLLNNLALIVELNGSTPLLNKTGLDDWDGVPLDLVVGFRGEETNLVKEGDLIWQFGFAEDITARGPSVDFTVFFSIGFRFNLFDRQRPEGDWLAKK